VAVTCSCRSISQLPQGKRLCRVCKSSRQAVFLDGYPDPCDAAQKHIWCARAHLAAIPAQEILAYLLSPQARQLRPLVVRELAVAADLLARDRARRAVAALPGMLTPRVPLLGIALPAPPLPPIFVPGLGLMSLDQAVRCAYAYHAASTSLCALRAAHSKRVLVRVP